MDWLIAIIAANPLAGITAAVVAVIAGYVAMTLLEQHRAEQALQARYDALRRERDKLWKDLQ